MSPTIASTDSSSRDDRVSARNRSRACRIALSLGQRARKVTPRRPRIPRDHISRW